MSKVTMVELYAPTLNSTRRFEIGHATRILQYTKGGWELPENSKFEFVNNELKLRSNKRNISKPSEDVGNTTGD
jgi:hypothetical protein